MRKYLTVFIVLFFVAAANAASPSQINAYIQQLQTKLQTAQKDKDTARVAKLQALIDEQQASLGQPAKAGGEEQMAAGAPASTDDLASLKEETNQALIDLKAQVDKVQHDNGDAKVGGVIFSQWSRITQNNHGTPNAFDVTRAYLNFTKNLDAGSSLRITLDVKRVADDVKTQNPFAYLKYAYFQTPLNVSALQAVPFSLNAKFGLQQNAWIDWDEGLMGMRYIMKSFLDDEGVMSSSDFGVGANGKISPASLPEIEYNAVLTNGSGYSTSETDAKKQVAVRLNSTVYDDPAWGKFIIGVFGNVASLNLADLTANGSDSETGTTVALKGGWGMAYLEYMTGTKSSNTIGGYSSLLVLNAAPIGVAALNAFYRLDFYQPNTSDATKDIHKSFGGLAYDWNKDIKLSVNQQNAQTGTGATTSTLYLNTQVSF